MEKDNRQRNKGRLFKLGYITIGIQNFKCCYCPGPIFFFVSTKRSDLRPKKKFSNLKRHFKIKIRIRFGRINHYKTNFIFKCSPESTKTKMSDVINDVASSAFSYNLFVFTKNHALETHCQLSHGNQSIQMFFVVATAAEFAGVVQCIIFRCCSANHTSMGKSTKKRFAQ